MGTGVAMRFSSSAQLAFKFFMGHRHKHLQGSYNVFLCVQASTVCVSGKLQADEK